jgi:hypothetical protein
MSLTITASLEDLSGTANVGGATFTLVGYGNIPPKVSGALLSVLSITATANGSGAISQVILGNDVVSPSGTTYVVSVFSSTGAFVFTARYSLTGSGTLDLSTLTPLSN